LDLNFKAPNFCRVLFTKIIHTTVKSRKQAEMLSGKLIKQGLAKCASFWQIRSIYIWEGKKADEKEYALEIKCANKNLKKAIAKLKELHPYKIPMILVFGAFANKEYQKWLKE
jgi:periplasmic divalent cation tolerance protein